MHYVQDMKNWRLAQIIVQLHCCLLINSLKENATLKERSYIFHNTGQKDNRYNYIRSRIGKN